MPKLSAVLFALLLASSYSAAASMSVDLAIRNVTVIDAVSGERTGQTVLIKGQKIVDVVDSEHIEFVADEVIDGGGRFLIPGLWDMHVHIVYEPGLIDLMPSHFLDYGVTSVRDTGALLDRITPQIERWQQMGAQAPDIFFSGPLLDGSLVVYNGDGRPEIGVSNSDADRVLDQVKTLKGAGASFIKIYELVSPEVFSSLVEAADSLNMPIAAHVPLSMMAQTAGPQVGSMEHLRNIEVACAENAEELHASRVALIQNPGDRSGYQLRSHLHSSQRPGALDTADATSSRCEAVISSLRHTIQVPTLRLNTINRFAPAARDDWQEHLDRLPKSVAEKWRQTSEYYASRPSELGNRMSDWSMALVANMQRLGIPVGAGTDTPIGQAIPGYSLHTELERLVEAGLSPRQALAAATLRPAEFFGLTDTMGQVKKGMEADLVLLGSNPFVDIRATRSIEVVISNGEQVR